MNSRRNFIKSVALVAGAFLAGKNGLSISSVRDNKSEIVESPFRVTETMRNILNYDRCGDEFNVYCYLPEGSPHRAWCDSFCRSIGPEEFRLFTAYLEPCQRDLQAFEYMTHVVGDDFYHPVTGLAFLTANPYEVILKIRQNSGAKNVTYTADGLGNVLPNICADCYLLSTHFQCEMRQKGVEVRVVYRLSGTKAADMISDWRGFPDVDLPCVESVYDYFNTPCTCRDAVWYESYYSDIHRARGLHIPKKLIA